MLAFPLGLFYFVFLVTGLSVGVSLVVIWVGIPILLVVAGAWWLFGAFERVQARYLLGATVPQAPREWERVDGIWGKLRAHFGSGATWMDLLYLLAKLVFGTISFTLLVIAVSMVGWFLAMPFFAILDVPIVNGTWVPPLWFGILAVPLGILTFFVSLHVLNGWSWMCARWAEVMFRGGTRAGGRGAARASGEPARLCRRSRRSRRRLPRRCRHSRRPPRRRHTPAQLRRTGVPGRRRDEPTVKARGGDTMRQRPHPEASSRQPWCWWRWPPCSC